MCSCMISMSLFVSERSPHARRLIELIKAWASSPPCSPRRPNPNPVFCMKSTQWTSKICCLGEMRVVWNLLLKNAMYSSIDLCMSLKSYPFSFKDCACDSCVWTTEYSEFSVLKSLQMSFATAWHSLSSVVSTVFLTTLSQMWSYAFRYLWQWLPTKDLQWYAWVWIPCSFKASSKLLVTGPDRSGRLHPVSYTHLTLPTTVSV